MPIIKKKKINTTSIKQKQVVKQRVNINVHIGNKGNKKRNYNKKPAQSQGQSSFTPVYIQSGYPSHLENIAHAPIPAPLAPPMLVNTSTPARTLLNPIPPSDIFPPPMTPSTPQIRIIQPPIHNNDEQIFRIGARIVTQAQRTAQDERNQAAKEKRTREKALLEKLTPPNVTQRDNRRGGGGFSGGGAFSPAY